MAVRSLNPSREEYRILTKWVLKELDYTYIIALFRRGRQGESGGFARGRDSRYNAGMAENIVRYEGSETVEAPGAHWEPIIVKEDNLPLQVGIGITIGLLFTGLILWSSKKLLPDVGDDKDDSLTQGFSEALGIKGEAFRGIPLKYKWKAARRGGFRRPGNPASIELELKVKNPRGVRIRAHKEGPFSSPVGFLPAEIETPPLTESMGFVIRMEPADALDQAGMKTLDEAVSVLCAGDLYDAKLEDNVFFFSLIRGMTYDTDESRRLLEAAARAAALFN